MVVYYIEGLAPGAQDAGDAGKDEGHAAKGRHLINTCLGQQELTYAARGNVFSFLMPWEEIQNHMHELVSDKEMKT